MCFGGRITTDAITIVLAEPEGMPPSIIMHWPGQPTLRQPRRFPEIASAVMKGSAP